MFIAMNRFTVPLDQAEEFEEVWRSRDSRLKELPGFVQFHLLAGPEADGNRLYASHTIWESEEAFQNWTRSEQFRAAHANAGGQKKLFVGAPRFEGFREVEGIGA